MFQKILIANRGALLLVLASVCATSALASTLSADGARQLRAIEKKERDDSDVVVVGYWHDLAPGCPDDVCNGTISSLHVQRGASLSEYQISYHRWVDFVRGTNMGPDDGRCARFYLKVQDGGAYEIVQYKQLNEKSSKCSRKS